MNNITISESIKYIGVDDTTLDLLKVNILYLMGLVITLILF